MTTFYRTGHWRTNAYGTTYWVSAHEVSRYDWPGGIGAVALTHTAFRSLTAAIPLDPQLPRSYTNPNATCPVCGAEVFFYQSQYGGRVFFDALGPPWPKHPCTDNGLPPGAVRSIHSHSYPWQSGGWKPLPQFKISKARSCIYKVTVEGDSPVSLYFKSNKSHLHRPPPILAHYKIEPNKTIFFSMYWLKGGASEFRMYKSPKTALSAKRRAGPNNSFKRTPLCRSGDSDRSRGGAV
jgi:hypothetical protein